MPANSPDLNPIEHLWARIKSIVKRWLRERNDNKPVSINELKEVILNAYNSITQQEINYLVCSFKKRLNLVTKHNGESINPYFHEMSNEVPLDLNVLPDEYKDKILTQRDLIASCDTSKPHIHSIQQISQLEIFVKRRKWTIDEDRILHSYVAQIGLKWDLISKGLTGRSPSSCRSRFQKIITKGKVGELEVSLNLLDMTHL